MIEAAPSKRILIVLNAVINRQPVTFTELVNSLPISRSGIWRALETLLEMNWIVKRNGDGAYRIAEEIFVRFHQLDYPTLALDDVSRLLKSFKNAGFDADYGQFVSPGQFRVLEATRASAYNDRPLSMVTDDLCIAAQSLLLMGELVRHIRVFQQFAAPRDKMAISKGEHAQIVTSARSKQIVWSQEGTTFSVGVVPHLKLVGAIRIHRGKNTHDSFASVAQSIPKGGNLQQLSQWIGQES